MGWLIGIVLFIVLAFIAQKYDMAEGCGVFIAAILIVLMYLLIEGYITLPTAHP